MGPESTLPEPALVVVEMSFRALRGVTPRALYAVYVDGRAVGSTRWGVPSAVVMPAGPHKICVKNDKWVSDVVELNLFGGDYIEVVCELKPLLRGKFFKFIESKFLLFALPLAIVAAVNPSVVRFIDEHLKYEFLGEVFLFCIGVAFGLLRLFSRKPGAMYSLKLRPAPVDEAPPQCTSAWESVRIRMQAVLAEGAVRYLVRDEAPIANQAACVDDRLDRTSAHYLTPLPLMLVAAVVDTVLVVYTTMPWFPRRPSLLTAAVALLNGVLIGLLLALQMWFILWLRKRFRRGRSGGASNVE